MDNFSRDDHRLLTQILPYKMVIGQEQLKLALELAYIAPSIGGVLISGQRGTGKSTAVRAFAFMVYGTLPVTLPINATEDRVVGGWKIDELMKGKAQEQEGLLEEANGKLLYIDEVNLLDDHIVNVILDVTSTGVLVVQREGLRHEKQVQFTLVGTMNPEEGGLRPQLLDRFGLMVSVKPESNKDVRRDILQTVLRFDEAKFRLSLGENVDFLDDARNEDEQHRITLERARQNLYDVKISEDIVNRCIAIADAFKAEGHRGDYIMALAARAYAALSNDKEVSRDHVKAVASLALQHRRPEVSQSGRELWTVDDDERLAELLDNV